MALANQIHSVGIGRVGSKKEIVEPAAIDSACPESGAALAIAGAETVHRIERCKFNGRRKIGHDIAPFQWDRRNPVRALASSFLNRSSFIFREPTMNVHSPARVDPPGDYSVGDWDDLRFFLAASRAGSFSAAARALGVSQPTVSRRVAQLEAVLDARLFEHRHGRLELTDPGHQVVAFAETIEDATYQLRRKVEGTESEASGKVGVTTTEGLASQWLAPKLAEFHDLYPEIEVTLHIGARKLDLLRGEADIALRFGNPDSLDLVGRRVAEAHAGIYASRGYIDQHGAPESLEDLSRFHLIEATGEIAGYRQCEKLNLLMRDAPRAGSVDNPYTQLALANANMGLIGIMCYMAEGYGSLVRLLPEAFDVSLDLWLLTHPDLKSSARVRAVIDFITAKIAADKALFHVTEA